MPSRAPAETIPRPIHKKPAIEILRGLAALAVCCFHFSGEEAGPNWWSSLSQFGSLGVEVFFVISGFVIPLSLARRVSEPGWARRFAAGRFWRLYPAYLATMIAAVALWWISWRLSIGQQEPFSIEPGRLAKNLSLTAGLFGGGWYVVVFWTLGIEAQYYLVLALVYRFLHGAVSVAGFVVMAVLALAPLAFSPPNTLHYCHFFQYSTLFVVGLAAFRFVQYGGRDALGWFAIALSFPVILFFLGVEFFVAALIPFALIIGRPGLNIPPLVWLGTISYSLYLTHQPIGVRFLKILKAQLPDWHPAALAWMTIPVCLLAAWIMYLLVEKPSLALASRFTRGGTKPAPTPAPLT